MSYNRNTFCILCHIGVKNGTFFFINKMNNDEVFNLIKHEHPQIIAMILSSFKSQQIADILERFDSANMIDIFTKICRLKVITKKMIKNLEGSFKLYIFKNNNTFEVNGALKGVEVLTCMSPALIPKLPQVDAILEDLNKCSFL